MARYDSDGVVVVGLGRFGQAMALELMSGGTDVLGIDIDEHIVQKMAGLLTHTVAADATDEEALRQLGVAEFTRAVVGIGHNLEASILTNSLLKLLGVKDVWAKAISEPHERILRQIGCDHVVRPEHDTGRRVAHLVAGRLLDYIEFDDGYTIVKMKPPACMVDRTLAEAAVRATYGVTVVGVKRARKDFDHAVPSTVVHEGDTVIVSGDRRKVEAFAEMNLPS